MRRVKATITVGVSASGKTTWALEESRKTGSIISNRDDLRFSLTSARDWSEYAFDSKVEGVITEIQKTTLLHAAVRGLDIICADTNLNKHLRDQLVSTCKHYGYDVIVRPFPISLEEAIERDKRRAFSVGESIIERQFKQWKEFIDG